MATDEIQKKFNENFKLISEEIKRQFELIEQARDKLDKKSELILGFIAIIVGYLISQDSFLIIFKTKYKLILLAFSIGLVSLIFSGIFAFLAYKPMDFPIGRKISELIENYRRNGTRDYRKVINRYIFNSCEENGRIVLQKSKNIKIAFVLMIVGLLFLIVSRVLNFFFQ